jgi:cyclopropane fatty-acyl-phospholipid synthase-like methyltransferase
LQPSRALWALRYPQTHELHVLERKPGSALEHSSSLGSRVRSEHGAGWPLASRSFIRTHIFPDGCLPSLDVIARCLARRTDMRTVALRDLTPHYAETLMRWRANFEAAATRLRDMGYDERFRRMWRMYLAYCEAGFAERRIGVVQMHLAKPAWHQQADLANTRREPLTVAF